MKLKAVISEGAPTALVEAFGTAGFTIKFLTEVVGEVLGVNDPQGCELRN